MRFLIYSLFLSVVSHAQLSPGFDIKEYEQLLLVSVRTAGDTAYEKRFPESDRFRMVYESGTSALDNKWDLWLDEEQKVAVISIRGTTANPESWLENIYAAMIPARGELRWEEDSLEHTFRYHFADHPDAAVHAGWTLGTALIFDDILDKMTSIANREGIRDFLIMGHSQGGAISYLVTSQLYSLREQGMIPDDWTFKTYGSASPKPGNLYFAYDYEARTQNGWGFNVVNASDWVPEVPFSIQTLDDFNEVNPFVHAEDLIAEQGFFERIGLWWVYRKLDRPTRQAQKNFERYLGEKAGNAVRAKFENLSMPEFVPSNHYVRTGITIVLRPDSTYRSAFPDNSKVFIHHTHRPYLFLTQRLDAPFYSQTDVMSPSEQIIGTAWNLEKIRTGEDVIIHADDDRSAYVYFDENRRLSGLTGCNSFSVSYIIVDDQLTIYRDLEQTELYCPDVPETEFIRALRSSNGFRIKDNRLILLNNNQEVMWFLKRTEN